MTQKLKTVGLYILQVILTAIASALIALLQNYLQAHGGDGSGSLSVLHTGAIGTISGSGVVAFNHLKNKC